MKAILLATALALALAPTIAAAQVVDTEFKIATGLVIGATIFDVETTYAALKTPGTFESNPIMRPFVESGRPGLYAVQFGLSAFAMYGAYEVKKAGYKEWWIIPASLVLIHAIAGKSNLRFVM